MRIPLFLSHVQPRRQLHELLPMLLVAQSGLRKSMRRAPRPVLPVVIKLYLWTISSLTCDFHLAPSENSRKRGRENGGDSGPQSKRPVTYSSQVKLRKRK